MLEQVVSDAGQRLNAQLTKPFGRGINLQIDVEAVAPDTPYSLGAVVRACLSRILALGVASPEEVGIETLQERLDQERSASSGIYVGDVMFGSWARKV
jgi:hypothetical protein